LTHLAEHIIGDRVHRLFVVVGLKQVAVAIHGDLEAAVACEGLNGLGAEVRFDPARDGEVP
jgi:hypothetical protein